MKFVLTFLAIGLIASPAFATDWGVAAPEKQEAKSDFGLGLFVPDAGTLSKVQETICINGVCYPVTNTVTTWAPVPNGVIFEAPQDGVTVTIDPAIYAYEVQAPTTYMVAATATCPDCGRPLSTMEARQVRGSGAWTPLRNWFGRVSARRAARLSARAARFGF